MFDQGKIKKILILRYRFIGDTVLTIPFVKNVRENFPDAQIDVLVSPNSGELLENNPDINNVIYFNNSKFHKYEKSEARELRSFFECICGLRKQKYDLAFVLKRSFSSALLASLAGIKYRIGFNTELRSLLLTHRVKYDKNIHELDNFLNCLEPLNIKAKKHIPEICLDKKEEVRANGFLVRLDRFKPKVLIHATSAHPYKMWPKRYFAKLMDNMFEQFEAQFVFTGANIDKEVYEKILSWCKHKNKFKILNLCGLISIRECYSVYKGLDLAICVDSGNAHIAAASGIPTYVLYGPTRPNRWLPVGKKVFPIRLNQLLPCQPCDVKVKCSHISCMKLMMPGFIFGKLSKTNKTIPA